MWWNKRNELAAAVIAATVAAAAAAPLSGCAPTRDAANAVDAIKGANGAGNALWQAGARHGRVLRAYAAGEDAARLPPCLAALPAGAWGARRFIRVRYRQGRLMREEVAELPPGMRADSGDTIEFWPADCVAGTISRVGRVVGRVLPGDTPAPDGGF